MKKGTRYNTFLKKEAKILILFCFVSLFSTAQEIPKFNAGFDFFLFNRNYESGYGTASYSSKGVFIEKGFQLNSLKQVILSPGISYKIINEDFSGGGMGGGFSNNLNHSSISSYFKIIYRTEINIVKPAVLYYGAFGGVHFITWARGSASSYSMFYDQANWKNSNYKEDPSHLFNKMYFGFLTGVEFTNNSFIKPSLELRLLPLYGEYKKNVLSPFEIAINMGFDCKKLNNKE